jgi:hypothetical protein
VEEKDSKMTALNYYCSADDARRLVGLSATDVSDADMIELIILAQSEVDKLTNTTYLVDQSTGTATSGNTTTVTDSGASWTNDEWNATGDLIGGYMCWIHTGTNAGEIRTIIDNTATALTVSPAFSAAIDNTSQYRIVPNTYRSETFDGNGFPDYFTRKKPITEVQSITIDETDVTLGTTYSYFYKKAGKITLGNNAEEKVWKDVYPQQCNVKYHWGVYNLPIIVKKLTAMIAAITAAEYMVGNTYTFATGYSIPELSVQKGVPYPHFEKLINQLTKQSEKMIANIKALVYPVSGG